MPFTPDDKTKKFVRWVKALINSGKVPSYQDVADNIDWDRTALSNVVNGRRNVPPEVYLKFTKVYKPSEIKDENTGLEIAIQNMAMCRVMLRSIAEVLSSQRGEPVAKTLGNLEEAVMVEIQSMSERL